MEIRALKTEDIEAPTAFGAEKSRKEIETLLAEEERKTKSERLEYLKTRVHIREDGTVVNAYDEAVNFWNSPNGRTILKNAARNNWK